MADTASAAAPAAPGPAEIRQASRDIGDGLLQTDLSVPSIRCGGCIRRIEGAVGALDGVTRARVNLSTRRLAVDWRADGEVPAIVPALADLGYPAHLDEPGAEGQDRTLTELVRAMAVAGFAAGNIMLLSVSVWSGAEGAARDLFHGVSALIALPALAYAGRPFFRSAAGALRHGRTNMDVPITVGVLLAFALSLYETLAGGGPAYFEAAMMLLFFLLVGRTLEHVVRERARRAVGGLARLVPRTVEVVGPDGTVDARPLAEVAPGTVLRVPAGARIPVDGRVDAGASDIDRALVTGESAPLTARAGSFVRAGTLNLTAPLTVTATAAEGDSFLAQMVRLMQSAESGRPAHRRIADRAARLYAPLVHGAAAASFAGWMLATGDLYRAATIAVAVLIITCPCALGLAAPMVQVVAARRLFDRGVLLKDGAALERLAEVDSVVLDKTGTLTLGAPVLLNGEDAAPSDLALAAAMAAHSQHPLARALAARAPAGEAAPALGEVAEVPGCGVEAILDGARLRLGRADWALDTAPPDDDATGTSETVLARDGVSLAVFRFDDPLRPGAREAVAALKARGLALHLVSGDRAAPVRRLAGELGIDTVAAGVKPQDKVACLERLAGEGCRVLMVGDGLNDAPALAAAHVAMAPGSAADVGRNAAGLVFLGDSLEAVPEALAQARRAGRLVRQNFALAILYNAVALPVAVAGFVTPLVAALAMSLSSITVVANALRLGARPWRSRRRREGPAPSARAGFRPEPAE